jgi:hypothetical protein
MISQVLWLMDNHNFYEGNIMIDDWWSGVLEVIHHNQSSGYNRDTWFCWWVTLNSGFLQPEAAVYSWALLEIQFTPATDIVAALTQCNRRDHVHTGHYSSIRRLELSLSSIGSCAGLGMLFAIFENKLQHEEMLSNADVFISCRIWLTMKCDHI